VHQSDCTRVLLQPPALELYDRVGKGAAVLSLAAVALGMAAHVQLALGVQRADLSVVHAAGPHRMHQAPTGQRGGKSEGLCVCVCVCVWTKHDSLVFVKWVSGAGVGAGGRHLLTVLTDDPGLTVIALLRSEKGGKRTRGKVEVNRDKNHI
jgi:hypothetical protein